MRRGVSGPPSLDRPIPLSPSTIPNSIPSRAIDEIKIEGKKNEMRGRPEVGIEV